MRNWNYFSQYILRTHGAGSIHLSTSSIELKWKYKNWHSSPGDDREQFCILDQGIWRIYGFQKYHVHTGNGNTLPPS